MAAETLLGEERLDKWIGGVDVASADESGKPRGAYSLSRLKATVDALIASVRDQLPKRAFHQWADDAEWAMYELKPAEAVDYPRQSDMFLGLAARPEYWLAAHGNGTFASERFSRHDEEFCYVKLDGSRRSHEERLQEKSSIEATLDAALKPAGLGCCVGGGTGWRYSYVDLALTDLRSGIDVVQQVLVGGKVPRRSWVLFFDDDLVDEWVGIYPETPPPPPDRLE